MYKLQGSRQNSTSSFAWNHSHFSESCLPTTGAASYFRQICHRMSQSIRFFWLCLRIRYCSIYVVRAAAVHVSRFLLLPWSCGKFKNMFSDSSVTSNQRKADWQQRCRDCCDVGLAIISSGQSVSRIILWYSVWSWSVCCPWFGQVLVSDVNGCSKFNFGSTFCNLYCTHVLNV